MIFADRQTTSARLSLFYHHVRFALARRLLKGMMQIANRLI